MPFAKALPAGQAGNLVMGLIEDLNSISIDGRSYPKNFVIREIKREVKAFGDAHSEYQISGDEVVLEDNTKSFMTSQAEIEEWLDKLGDKIPSNSALAARSAMALLIETSASRQEEVARYNTLATLIVGLRHEVDRLESAQQVISAGTSLTADMGLSALAAHRATVYHNMRGRVLDVLRRASGSLAYATLNPRLSIFKELFELITENGDVLEESALKQLESNWSEKLTIPADTTRVRGQLHTSKPMLKGHRIIFDGSSNRGKQYLRKLKKDRQVVIDLAPGLNKSRDKLYFANMSEVRVDRVCCYLAHLG
ncbi:MAG: hypothetical protein JWQ42_4042 [Edaphobacter sp.]|nr:hypothetical protein [Edaphobacter sp.]